MGRTFTLRDQVVVEAPLDRIFLLSTSVRIVEQELRMHPVAGRTTGFVIGGDTVLWKGWQLGLPQFHKSLISQFEPNRRFQDTMISGRFRHFQHDHVFEQVGDEKVRLSDEIRFSMPFGVAGELVGRVFLVPHIRRLLRRRFALLKRTAETDAWRDYLLSPSSPASDSLTP